MSIFGRALFLLVFTALPSVAQQNPAAELGPSGVALPVPSVKLIEVGQATSEDVRAFFGRIAARETVDLSFEVGGHLIEFPVVEGSRVASGELIARLELGAFERAVEEATLTLAQAERALLRAESLAQSNAGSGVQAENAQTERDLADVRLREAQAALSDATLNAPFDGLVATRVTPNFSNIEAGQPILRLHDMSEVRVEIDVPERLFRLTDGIVFDGILPARAEPVPLEIAEFNAETGQVGQTFRVSLRLPPLEDATLIPGASMTVRARVARPQADGFVLPATAIQSGADRRARVMIYEETGEDSGTLREMEVEVQSVSGTELSVAGLSDGMMVVAVGGHMLRSGATVRPYRGLTVEE